MIQAIETNREDNEAALIARAQTAMSRCNWEVGECAALWTKRFARGRTDADFGILVGLSADQVYQRRRVWESFGDVAEQYPSLKWSHFYAALTWEDAAECLQWAQDVHAGVAEMKAWRRAQRGEDLSGITTENPNEFSSAELTFVEEAVPFEPGAARNITGSDGRQLAALSAGEATASVDRSYAPFREDAATPPSREDSPRSEPTTEQLVKRMTTALERCHSAITPQFCRQFSMLPEKVRLRFLKSIEQLSSKAESLNA